MIIGIGVDLCNISRIKKAIESQHFRDRIFTPEEIAYCEKKGEKSKAESYAGFFAAREAFSKASGIDLARVMFDGNFALIHDENGMPKIKLSDKIGFNDADIFVSITHEKEYACAMVIIERRI